MKRVVYDEQTISQLRETVSELVERGYFGEEDYAVNYVREIVMYFQWNINSLIAHEAPSYFNRYAVHNRSLQYVTFRKSARTTWYAFFEENDMTRTIVYIANNHLIGHKLDISL